MDVSFLGFVVNIGRQAGRHTHSTKGISERGYLDECETDDISHNSAIIQHHWVD